MANKQNNGQPGDRLREQAEKVARQAIELAPEDSTSEETKLLLRELRIYQIELEMQNDELRETQIIVEAQRERYFVTYDQAPVGYFTLSKKGLILDANLAFATLLGTDKNACSTQLFQPIHSAR